jgi:hypothetical protein
MAEKLAALAAMVILAMQISFAGIPVGMSSVILVVAVEL